MSATALSNNNEREDLISSIDVQSSLPAQRGIISSQAPAKGFFNASAGAISPPTATKVNGFGAVHSNDASIPSSVPKNGRRRESISSQMRRLATESTAVAAGGGGLSFHRSVGQTIAPRGTIKGGDAGSLPASLSSAAEALAGKTNDSIKTERAGHTHLGKECYIPASSDDNASKGARRGSFSSVATDDDRKDGSGGLHRCEACSKVYRHPSCLIKHRWEHTLYWKEASKFLMSKHQQVQLLEAAAILVGMDTNPRSLPEEKALWPAAVSPRTSGLLGSEKINFETLMALKGARKANSPVAERSDLDAQSVASTTVGNGSVAHSMPTHSSSLSPLNNFTALNLGRFGRNNGDVGSFRLDESAERSVREESAETEGDDDDDREFDDSGEGDESMTGSTSISTGSPSRDAEERERYGAGAGGDVLAELEMEGVE